MDPYKGNYDFGFSSDASDFLPGNSSRGPSPVRQPFLDAADGNYGFQSNDASTYLRAANSSTSGVPRSIPGPAERQRTHTDADPDFGSGGVTESKTPFDRYCAEIRRLKNLNPDEERWLQVRLAEIAEKLVRTISGIPISARYIVDECRRDALPGNSGDSVTDDSEINADGVTMKNPFDVVSLLAPEGRDEPNDGVPGAELAAQSSGFPPFHRLTALLDSLHFAARQYGVAHEITRSHRAVLAEAIRTLPLPPSYLKSLVARLRSLLDNQQQFQQNNDGVAGSAGETFEVHHAIRLEEFERILREASRLYLEWESIRNRIAEFHVGLVVYLARQYSSDPQELVDLIQEGNIGLLKAVERYNYRLGFRFSTYATYWIRLAMSRYIARSSRAVRLPYRQNLNIGSARKKRESFRQIHGRYPSTLELARETGISEAGLVKLETLSQVTASLDAQLEPGENLDLLSMLEQQTFSEPVETVEKQDMNGLIENAINGLNQREAYVIRQRFGIGVYAEKTLQELGAILGLTRERVRQIESGALKKIRRRLEPLAV
jgi:RNA polymerase sigma factor (sigma-70 family)